MALTDQLVAHWRLDEASGNRLDSHGSNHLTPSSVGSGVGKIGNAATYSSSGAVLSADNNAELQLGADSAFTVALWFNAASLSLAWQPLICKGNSGTTPEFEILFVLSTESIVFHVTNGSGGQEQVSIPFAATNTDSWHYLVAWHDPDENKIFIQLDNGTPAEISYSGGTNSTGGVLEVGRFPWATAFSWYGSIDAISYWKRVLTDEERTQLFNVGDGLDYPFSSGGTTVDASAAITAASLANAEAKRLLRASASSNVSSSITAETRKLVGAMAGIGSVSTIGAGAVRIKGVISSVPGHSAMSVAGLRRRGVVGAVAAQLTLASGRSSILRIEGAAVSHITVEAWPTLEGETPTPVTLAITATSSVGIRLTKIRSSQPCGFDKTLPVWTSAGYETPGTLPGSSFVETPENVPGCGCSTAPPSVDPCELQNRCNPNNCVLRTGDTMTGPLILSEHPEGPNASGLQAATKDWVLSKIGPTVMDGARMEVIALFLVLGPDDDYAIVPLLQATILQATVWVPDHLTGKPYSTTIEMQNDPNRSLRVAFRKGLIPGGRADLVLTRVQ